MKKLVTCLLLLLACAGLGFGLMRWWVIAHLDLSHILSARDARPREVANVIDSLSQKIQQGKLPAIKEDFGTLGSPKQEARLLELRRLMQVFEVGFGRPPKDSSELARLIKEGALATQQQETVRQDIRECQVLTLSQDSYLLNCDGWLPTNSEGVKRLVEQFDKGTERFYAIAGHLFLYSPPYATPAPVTTDPTPGRVAHP